MTYASALYDLSLEAPWIGGHSQRVHDMTMYSPKPIDTSAVTLSAELLQLTEQLAENAHDVWAVGRMEEGWTWGEQRDDAAKEHPDLVAYADLSESEKQYDRNTAMETLKAIVALGYRIEHA